MRLILRLALALFLLALSVNTVFAEPGAAPLTNSEKAVFYSAGVVLLILIPFGSGILVARTILKLSWKRPLFFLVVCLVALPLAAAGLMGWMLLGLGMAGRTM